MGSHVRDLLVSTEAAAKSRRQNDQSCIHKSKKGEPIDISKEIGLNKEDLMEYMAWILENDKKEEEKLLIGLTLCSLGVEVSDAEWAASNPEILKEIIDEMINDQEKE